MTGQEEKGGKFPFEASEFISGKDGWLTPTGEFYSCRPDEHDKCAEFVLSRFKTDILKVSGLMGEKEEDISELPARVVLGKYGYVQLSHGEVILPRKFLTAEQIKLLIDAEVPIPQKETAFLHTSMRVDFNDEIEKVLKAIGGKIDLIIGIQKGNPEAGKEGAELDIFVQTGKPEVVGDRGERGNTDWSTVSLRFSEGKIGWVKFNEMFSYTEYVQDVEELRQTKEAGQILTPPQEEFLQTRKLYGNLLEENIALAPVLLLGFVVPEFVRESLRNKTESKKTHVSGTYGLRRHGFLDYYTRLHDYGVLRYQHL